MAKEIYLDNAATTPCDPQVLKSMNPYWSRICGNASSFNDAGREAKKTLDQSHQKIARILGAKNQEIIFTSSATEANNLTIFGIAKALKNIKHKASDKYHIITTKIEHHSVLEPLEQLEKEVFDITYLNVNKEGLINLEEFKKAIKPETILVSIIYVNNEISSIQPIKKISKVIKIFKNSKLKIENSLYPYFHTDAAQAANHLDINVNNLGVDLMTLSSHKIYGPKGVASLYIRQGTGIRPLTLGGGQEWGLRSGTEAIPLIAGFAKAIEKSQKTKIKNRNYQENLRKHFIEKLKIILPDVKINGPENPKDRAPHIINQTFPGIENEQLLLYLDKYGVRASAGSACTSKDIEPSHVLRAIGLSKEEARSSIRFSLGKQISKADLDYVLKILPKMVKRIRELYPKNLKKQYYVRTN